MVYLWRWLWREGVTAPKNTTEPFANTKCETDTSGHLAGCTGRLQIFIITPWRLRPVPLTHFWREVFFWYRWACQACSLVSSERARAITGECIAQCVSPWEFGVCGLAFYMFKSSVFDFFTIYLSAGSFICPLYTQFPYFWWRWWRIVLRIPWPILYSTEPTENTHSCYCHPGI